MTKDCPKCNTQHNKSGIFCSRKCSNSRIQTLEANNSRRDKLRKLDYKVCPICQEKFLRQSRKNFMKTCSKKCGSVLGKLTRNKKIQTGVVYKKMGGLRERSGRGKSGWYKGFFLYSSYELAFVIYCLDHDIHVQKCPYTYEYQWNNKTLKYYPDFIIDDDIIEIKGYRTKQVDAKIASVNDRNIKVYYKENLEEVFKYVEQKYKISRLRFYELYETKNIY